MRLSILFIFLMATCTFASVAAPLQAVDLIRDADIEHSLDQLAAPILLAAILNPSNVRILVINDGGLNAFVISSRAIFIHSGLLQKG